MRITTSPPTPDSWHFRIRDNKNTGKFLQYTHWQSLVYVPVQWLAHLETNSSLLLPAYKIIPLSLWSNAACYWWKWIGADFPSVWLIFFRFYEMSIPPWDKIRIRNILYGKLKRDFSFQDGFRDLLLIWSTLVFLSQEMTWI